MEHTLRLQRRRYPPHRRRSRHQPDYLRRLHPSSRQGSPHERDKLRTRLHKTALGAENSIPSEQTTDLPATISRLKSAGVQIIALEQSPNSIPLQHFTLDHDSALILGEERYGIPPELLQLCDTTLEIPMVGQKESFNVSVAAGIALWQLIKPL